MSVRILRQSAELATLENQGPVGRPLSEPACRIRGMNVALAGAGKNRTGLWECSPGRFERQVAEAEVMHILSGSCSFTPEGGEPLEIRAGDTALFPPHTKGVWDIRETVRKVYVVLAPDAP